jgi:catechol 2,3-dioxygenase-like lactoylglutathione lyase family enzyme
MDLRRAIPVVRTADPAASRRFYEEFLGFEVRMEQDGMLMLASPAVPTTQVILGWDSPTAMDDALLTVDLSVEVDDVDSAYAAAQADGLEIVRTIRDEPWGIRRFFVRDPGGQVVNVAMHR